MTERSGQDIIGNPQAGALTGTEAVEVARGPGAPTFKTTTQAIANLGTSAGVSLAVAAGGTMATAVNYLYFSGATLTNPSAGYAHITYPPALLMEGSQSASSISNLPTASALSGTELLVGVQGTTDVQMTTQAVANLGTGGGGGAIVGNTASGISVVTNSGTSTITNTGTLVQPTATGTGSGTGVLLQGGNITNTSTAGYPHAGTAYLIGGNNTIMNSAHNGSGGNGLASGGSSYNGTIAAKPAYISARGGNINGTTLSTGGNFVAKGGNAIRSDTNTGGGLYFSGGGALFTTGVNTGGTPVIIGGYASGGSTNTGGGAVVEGGWGSDKGGNTTIAGGGDGGFQGGSGGTLGGNLILSPGVGLTNGVLLVSNIGTVDPHVLNAKWQTSVAGVGFVGVYSKG